MAQLNHKKLLLFLINFITFFNRNNFTFLLNIIILLLLNSWDNT